jgi:hypothetical protein
VTAEPSSAAVKAALYRERLKQATPPDVAAMLERGRRERLELQRRANAVRSLARIEATVARKIIHIQSVKQPSIRARLLGDLADWIIEHREALADDFGLEAVLAAHKRRRVVPAWVPEALVFDYLNPELTEFEAAAHVRKMKREAAGES